MTLALATPSYTMMFAFAQLVGSYRLVVSADLVAFIEQAFVEPAPVAEQAAIRAEALAEAEAARLIILADGTIISRAGAVEFYRVQVLTGEERLEELAFEKGPGHVVLLQMLDADTVRAVQAGKPDATFRRDAP